MNKKIGKEIRDFMEEREWFDAVPANLAKSISIEAAELLEHFQWKDPSVAEISNDEKIREEISKEIADILIYSVHLAELLELDYEEIMKKKLTLAGKKYPAEKVKGPAGSEAHMKIKKEWREKGLN